MYSILPFKHRLELYGEALMHLNKYYENHGTSLGFCTALERAYINTPHLTYLSIEDFPEIYRYKPFFFNLSSSSYWFSRDEKGYKKRVKILSKVITKMQKKIDNDNY